MKKHQTNENLTGKIQYQSNICWGKISKLKDEMHITSRQQQNIEKYLKINEFKNKLKRSNIKIIESQRVRKTNLMKKQLSYHC